MSSGGGGEGRVGRGKGGSGSGYVDYSDTGQHQQQR